MGNKINEVSEVQLRTTADALIKAAGKLLEVAEKMHASGIPEENLPWNKRQFDCLDVIVTSSNKVAEAIDGLILAKVQKRDSHSDKVIARRINRQKKKQV